MSDDAEIKRILVGVDSSKSSAAALRWAIGVAKVAEVLAIHAFEAPYPTIAPPAGGVPVDLGSEELSLEQSLRAVAEQAFDTRWCAPLTQAGIRQRRLFLEGRPGDLLLEVAEREQVDLVVTGRRGGSSLAELFAGSVSQHLVHKAQVPVVIVPRPAHSEDRSKT